MLILLEFRAFFISFRRFGEFHEEGLFISKSSKCQSSSLMKTCLLIRIFVDCCLLPFRLGLGYGDEEVTCSF